MVEWDPVGQGWWCVCVHLPENKGVVVVVFGNGLIDMHSLYPTYAVVAQRVMESS